MDNVEVERFHKTLEYEWLNGPNFTQTVMGLTKPN